MDRQQIQFIIANTAPFSSLDAAALSRLLEVSGILQYQTGQEIYHEGEKGGFFYFLLQGRVGMVSETGQEIELLKRGASFGIISLLTDQPHSVTARALENSFLIQMSKHAFNEFLSEHPFLALDFSRMLSQRVTKRIHPKKIFACTKIGIAGATQTGKTTYLFTLGCELKSATGKNVLCIEIGSQERFRLAHQADLQVKPLTLSEFAKGGLGEYIMQGNVDCLTLDVDRPILLPALLNVLSEDYHYLLYEVPLQGWDELMSESVKASDQLHLLSAGSSQAMKRTGFFIKRLVRHKFMRQENIKVLLNDRQDENGSAFVQKCNLLGVAPYATLAHKDDGQYQGAVRRIARHLGGVVVGLALGSGGSYGFAHIGVLKVLRQHAIDIDVVCGSSMGAFVGALWAAGFSSEKIEAAARDFGKKIRKVSVGGISFPLRGFFKARRLENALKKIFGDMTFYDLNHTLKIVAFDFLKRQAKIIDQGYVYKAVAASCALPGIFEPVVSKSQKREILLDGGILNPLPTKILLQCGVNKIIAVNITPSREEICREYTLRNRLHIFDFIFGSIETMQRQFIEQALQVADVVIHPDMQGLGWTEFDKVGEFVARGEKVTEQTIARIRELVVKS